MIADTIQNYMSTNFSGASVQRSRGRFQNMLNDKISASWGWTTPVSYAGQKIVYLTFSPEKKGDKQSIFYDFVTDEEYIKMPD